MDAQAAKLAELQEQLVLANVELLRLSAQHGELNDELNRVKSQYGAGATVSDDLRLVAGACERPAKRAKKTQSCKESSTTPSTAESPAALTEKDDLKNCSEVLTLENQCISGLVAET